MPVLLTCTLAKPTRTRNGPLMLRAAQHAAQVQVHEEAPPPARSTACTPGAAAEPAGQHSVVAAAYAAARSPSTSPVHVRLPSPPPPPSTGSAASHAVRRDGARRALHAYFTCARCACSSHPPAACCGLRRALTGFSMQAGPLERAMQGSPPAGMWPGHSSLPPPSPPASVTHPHSPLAYAASGPPAHTRHQPPHSAPAHSLPAPHNYGPPPPATLHPISSLPAVMHARPEAGRASPVPQAAPYAYPQNVYPYNPGSRGGSERSSQAYSQPGQPLSRGASGGPAPPNPTGATPPPVSSFGHAAAGASRQSGHGNSGHSSHHDGPYPRAPDSASNAPSPPSSLGRSHHHIVQPPERIQSRYTPRVPRSLMSSRDSAPAYMQAAAPSTHGSGGGGGGSYSSTGGSAARGNSRHASSGPGAPLSDRDALDGLGPASAAAQRQRQLGSPLVGTRQRAHAVEVTAAEGVVPASDLETNQGSAAVDHASRGALSGRAAACDTARKAGAGPAAAAKLKPPLRIAMPAASSGKSETREMTELTQDLDFSLTGLDMGDTHDTDHRYSCSRDGGPLLDTLKPSSAKITASASRPSSLASGVSRTGSADPGPFEPPPSAALCSSRPSSSLSARGTAPAAAAGQIFLSTGPASVSPPTHSSSGRDAAASARPLNGSHSIAGPAAVAQTVTLDDTSSSFGMSHTQLCRALDALTARNTVLLQRYMLLDASQRRLSGHGVVQFAETEPTEATVSESTALKFYLIHAAFDRVASLCSQRALAGVTRAVMDTVKGSDITGCEGAFEGAGSTMPPMVVTRRGLTLQEWAARGPLALPVLMRALAAVCSRLADLHACGYVYYAVKPTNVAWFEWGGGWQLIDFGRAARAGTPRSAGFACTGCSGWPVADGLPA